jgi:hypothetical protein
MNWRRPDVTRTPGSERGMASTPPSSIVKGARRNISLERRKAGRAAARSARAANSSAALAPQRTHLSETAARALRYSVFGRAIVTTRHAMNRDRRAHGRSASSVESSRSSLANVTRAARSRRTVVPRPATHAAEPTGLRDPTRLLPDQSSRNAHERRSHKSNPPPANVKETERSGSRSC